MKIDNHPYLYNKYKDKRVQFYGIQGTIVGYFFIEKKNPILVMETNGKSNNPKTDSIKIWTKNNSFVLEDYHGDITKKFYLINEKDFDGGFAIEI